LFQGLSEGRLEEAAQEICKLLNVGHGDMHLKSEVHTSQSLKNKEAFERGERSLTENTKRFFKLFEESMFDGSRAAAREMKKIAKRQIKHNQKFLLFHSLFVLIRSDSEMLSWPNSPLLVMLQFVDPNVMPGTGPLEEGLTRQTPLHDLAELANSSDYSTHENQLILAKQLIEHGANVNAVSSPHGATPLQKACSWTKVTNLDFIQLLLEAGADPNSQDHLGRTPLIYTFPDAPGAAKFLLNWPTTDANIADRSGGSFQAEVQRFITLLSDRLALSDNPEQVQHQFLLQRWIEIEEMLVERGSR
jgi:hypothetical protein